MRDRRVEGCAQHGTQRGGQAVRRRFTIARALLGVAIGLLVGGFAPGARAADVVSFGRGDTDAPYDITADVIEYDRERELYTANGNVRIEQPGRTLTADWVAFSNRTRQGVASGNVVMAEAGDTLHATFVQFGIDSMQGLVFDGRLDARTSSFRMEGAEVQRTGEQTYSFRDGRFTTCRCPEEGERDPWAIRASKADLEIGGYGTARNTTFDVLGVPVLWFPWMIYPLKTERQSGLLLPTFGHSSRSGFAAGLPYFWAVNESVNLTLNPTWLTSRGFKPESDLEYVFGTASEGRFVGSFLHDTSIKEDDTATPFGENRWAVRWSHDHFLPAEWRAKFDLRMESDNSYPQDFSDFSEVRIDRYLESKAFVMQHFGESGRLGLVAALYTADDLQNPDDSDRDRFVMQRLPDLSLTLLPKPLTESLPLLATVGARYTYFTPWKLAENELPSATRAGRHDQFLDTGIDATPGTDERSGGVAVGPGGGDPHGDDFATFGGPENDGVFEEGEPLNDRGHRLQLTPRLAWPTRLGGLVELYPEVGWRETLYDTVQAGFAHQGWATGRVDLRTRLRGRLDLPFSEASVTHLLEPSLGWAVVQETSQADDPLFVPGTAFPQRRVRQLDLENVTLDPADRVERFQGVTVGFGNRFYGSSAPGEAPRMLGDVRVSGQYDFSRTEPGDVYVEGSVLPGHGFGTRFIAGFDPDRPRFDEGLVEGGWSSAEGHDLAISYRYLHDLPRFFESFRSAPDRFQEFDGNFDRVNQIGTSARVALTRSWALTYSLAYSFESSLWLGNTGGVEYLSRCRCWAVRVEAQHDRTRGFTYNFYYRLVGLGEDTTRPFAGGVGRGASGFLDDTKRR